MSSQVVTISLRAAGARSINKISERTFMSFGVAFRPLDVLPALVQILARMVPSSLTASQLKRPPSDSLTALASKHFPRRVAKKASRTNLSTS